MLLIFVIFPEKSIFLVSVFAPMISSSFYIAWRIAIGVGKQSEKLCMWNDIHRDTPKIIIKI